MFGSKESIPSKDNDQSKSSNSKPSTSKPSRLDFEGKKYEIDNLPDDIKELLNGIQVADGQMRMYQDTLKLLDLSRKSLISQLKQKLETIPHIEE